MKQIILVLILSFLTVLLNAQSKSPVIFGNAVVKNKKMQRAGAVLSLVGGVTLFTGNIMYWKIYKDYANSEPPADKVRTYSNIIFGGLGLIAVGIPLWTIGKVKERHIEVAMVGYKGSASVNCIGLKIRF